MDRVFRKSEINDLCEDLNDIIKDCQDQIEELKEIARSAKHAAADVPAEVSTGEIISAADAFLSEAEAIDLKPLTQKLSGCKTRVSMIAIEDQNYGIETDTIKTQVNTIKQVLEQMESFLGNVSLRTKEKYYMIALKTASTKWNKDLTDIQQSIDQINANLKGHERTSSAFSKDPVNLSTGNFIYDRTDLQIGGKEPFIFRRFYNAINKRSKSLGDDWNHNYEIILETEGTEKVLHLEEGKEERFLKVSSGVYASLYHSNGTLEETETGYHYQTRAQVSYVFDKEGYCIRRESISGEVITLEYEKKETKKQLVKAVKETGEYFMFIYSQDGYLHQVSDQTGRSVTYQIQRNKLIGVCTPGGRWYRYGYSLTGKLESIQNPRGITTVENRYDEQQRTIYQSFPDGGSMSYEYDDDKRAVILTERNGSKVTYIHDEQYRDIKHIYRNAEERYEYNKRNQKTLAVDKAGNKTQYGYDEGGNLTRIINAQGVKTELQYEANNQPTYIRINGKTKVKNRYNEAGELTESTDALGNTYQIKYREKGQPKEIRQPDGSTRKFRYDHSGNMIQLTDAAGNISRYAYDGLNRVREAIDGNGNKTTYTYDDEDNLTSVTNAKGATRRYEYNESNKVTKIIDFDGSELKREYNVLNRPSKIIDQLGRETILSYDVMWNLARITEANGAKTTYLYNEDNQLGRIRTTNGAIIRYEYDINGNRTGITDEAGNKTCFTYDALGQLIGITKAAGNEIHYCYDEVGNLTKVTNALGNETILSYDAGGNLITETGPTGEERTYTYTALGKIASITDEAGRTTSYRYEMGGRVKEIHYPEGRKESYCYDGNGNIKTYTDQRGYTCLYTYDSLDQVIKITEQTAEEAGEEIANKPVQKEYTYDSIGNVISMTNENGNKTTYEYTATGQLKSVIDALGNRTEYCYDVCDRLIEIRQYGNESESTAANAETAAGIDKDLLRVQAQNQYGKSCQITRYERDISGRIVSVTDAIGQKETYGYSEKGELIEKVDKEGYLTRYGYTANGEIKQIQYADGREVKLSYSPLRYLQEIKDWLGITKINNDAAGRATKVQYPDGKEVTYAYGISGEQTSITYPDGKTVNYKYDEQLRLKELKEGIRSICYEYNQSGDLIHKQYPGGMETDYKYNRKGQLTNLTHSDQKGVLDDYRYEYDRVGNKISIEKQRRGLAEESGQYHYRYDEIGRLFEVSKNGIQTSVYRYDAFGNRLGKQENGPKGGREETTYYYNAINQLIKKVGSEGEESYRYDQRGNLTQRVQNGKIKNEYVYGAINRLEEAKNYKGEIAKYRYNGLGHRIGKETWKQSHAPGRTIDYLIDLTRQYHNLLQSSEKGSERKQTQTYVWDGGAASVFTEEIQSLESAGAADIRTPVTTAPATPGILGYAYYLQDELGSPIRLMEESGTIREHYGYDEFGQDLYPKEKNHLQPFGYTGYQSDDISGTYYAEAREYRPEVGRFTSEDTHWNQKNMIYGDNDRLWQVPNTEAMLQSKNRYVYCISNPLKFVDRRGKDIIIINKPVEQDALRKLGQEHMSLIIQDENGNWHYASYYGGKYTLKQINDTSVLTDIDKLNDYLYANEFLNKNDKQRFHKSVYVKGDFTEAYKQAYSYKENIADIPYDPNMIQAEIDGILGWAIEKFTENKVVGTEYSFLFNHCGHVAIQLFRTGILPDGTKVDDIWRILEILFGMTETPGKMFSYVRFFMDAELPTAEDLCDGKS